MKKIFTLLMALAFEAGNVYAAYKPVFNSHPLLAEDYRISLGNSGKEISLMELSTISREDLEDRTGKKMNFLERKVFKMSQKKLKKAINEDGTLNDKMLGKAADITSGFHLGGFALGFFLWLIGVLIAYLINDDKKQARVKWAWIGAAIATVLGIIFAVI